MWAVPLIRAEQMNAASPWILVLKRGTNKRPLPEDLRVIKVRRAKTVSTVKN